MVVIDSRKMVIEENCGYVMGPAIQTVPKKTTITTETKKTPEHSEEYYRAVAMQEARAKEKELTEMGVPTVEQLAASFGISAEEISRPAPEPHYLTESEIESMLPTEEEILATLLGKDPVVNRASIPKPEVESELDEMGIPTIEAMKKEFGIKR